MTNNYQKRLKEKYFDEVIRLYYQMGYSANKIESILPIGHTTAGRWIHKFAAENEDKPIVMARKKHRTTAPKAPARETKDDIVSLKVELAEMENKLKLAELRAELYDEMIDVAEKKFKVEIRKKAGAKR